MAKVTIWVSGEMSVRTVLALRNMAKIEEE